MAIYWGNLEQHTKASIPWLLMSAKQQPATSSLLLDYVTPNSLLVIQRSARARHFSVLTAAIGSLIVVSTTVASTGLFSLQSKEVETDMIMSISSSFDATGVDLSSIDALPVLLVSSILSGNLSLSYPLYTNEQFAVASFSPQKIVAGEYTL